MGKLPEKAWGQGDVPTLRGISNKTCACLHWQQEAGQPFEQDNMRTLRLSFRNRRKLQVLDLAAVSGLNGPAGATREISYLPVLDLGRGSINVFSRTQSEIYRDHGFVNVGGIEIRSLPAHVRYYAFLISHLISLILTSSPAFSS